LKLRVLHLLGRSSTAWAIPSSPSQSSSSGHMPFPLNCLVCFECSCPSNDSCSNFNLQRTGTGLWKVFRPWGLVGEPSASGGTEPFPCRRFSVQGTIVEAKSFTRHQTCQCPGLFPASRAVQNKTVLYILPRGQGTSGSRL
jgi:hypothetical protein